MFPQHRKEKESDGGASPDPAESASKLKVSPPSSPSVHAEGGGDIRPVDVLHANPERAGKRAMSPPCSSSVPVGGGNKSDSGNISPGPFEEAKKIKIEDFGTSKSLGVLQCPSATKYEDESSLSAKSTITSLGFSKTSEEKQQQKPSPPSESSFVPTRSEASSSSARSFISSERKRSKSCSSIPAARERKDSYGSRLPWLPSTSKFRGPVAKDASQPTVFKPPDFLHDDSKPPSLHSVEIPQKYLNRPLVRKENEIFQVMSARLIHRALALRYKMTVTNIPLEPFPGISVEVFHSQSFFESTGPLLIIIQGGTFSTAGVWEPDHLLQSGVGRFAKGLESGSQIRLAEMAHALGYALAIINLNSVVDRRPLPEDLDPETESVAVCELLPVASAPSSTNSSTVLRRRQARICLSEFPIIPQPMCHVELEERLVCVWLHLMKRCASQQICVWAHQMAAAYFLYPLRPFPCEWRTGAHPGVATASDLPSQLSTKVPNPSPYVTLYLV
uniref:Non-specific serine/threonine protein kinase n=1 Tax=Mesocestoides corti TaxID=53468 RepID=A0A5K3ESS5_MESCO